MIEIDTDIIKHVKEQNIDKIKDLIKNGNFNILYENEKKQNLLHIAVFNLLYYSDKQSKEYKITIDIIKLIVKEEIKLYLMTNKNDFIFLKDKKNLYGNTPTQVLKDEILNKELFDDIEKLKKEKLENILSNKNYTGHYINYLKSFKNLFNFGDSQEYKIIDNKNNKII